MAISIDELLAAMPRGQQDADIAAINGRVTIRVFTKSDLDEIRVECMAGGEHIDQAKFERLLLQRGLIEPALADAHFAALTESAAAYYALLNAILEVNGLAATSAKTLRRAFPARS